MKQEIAYITGEGEGKEETKTPTENGGDNGDKPKDPTA